MRPFGQSTAFHHHTFITLRLESGMHMGGVNPAASWLGLRGARSRAGCMGRMRKLKRNPVVSGIPTPPWSAPLIKADLNLYPTHAVSHAATVRAAHATTTATCSIAHPPAFQHTSGPHHSAPQAALPTFPHALCSETHSGEVVDVVMGWHSPATSM